MTSNLERIEALEKRWAAIDRRVEFCVRFSTWIVLGFCVAYTGLRFAGCLQDEIKVVTLDEAMPNMWLPPSGSIMKALPDGDTEWRCEPGHYLVEDNGMWICKE